MVAADVEDEDLTIQASSGFVGVKTRVHWIYPPGIASGKWRFIGIPYKNM